MKIPNQEIRTLSELSLRAASEDEQSRFVEGRAIRFDHRSRLIIETINGKPKAFYERIAPNALDEVLQRDGLNVVATFNHDRLNPLARTKSGTLKLEKDDQGLLYRFDLPNTTLGNDVHELLERGEIKESSFVYTTDPKTVTWSRAEDGIAIRTVNKITGLYDVALVVDAAYSDTDVALRQLQEFEGVAGEDQEQIARALRVKHNQLEILKYKI